MSSNYDMSQWVHIWDKLPEFLKGAIPATALARIIDKEYMLMDKYKIKLFKIIQLCKKFFDRNNISHDILNKDQIHSLCGSLVDPFYLREVIKLRLKAIEQNKHNFDIISAEYTMLQAAFYSVYINWKNNWQILWILLDNLCNVIKFSKYENNLKDAIILFKSIIQLEFSTAIIKKESDIEFLINKIYHICDYLIKLINIFFNIPIKYKHFPKMYGILLGYEYIMLILCSELIRVIRLLELKLKEGER